MIHDLKGFTLVEALLSFALIAAIAGLSIPVYHIFQVRNDLDVTAMTIAQTARRAGTLARASEGDAAWGVHVATSSIVLFKGSVFAARDTALDEVFEMPKSITPTGDADLIFGKFTGLPVASSTITLISSANETRTITINPKGTVGY